MKSLDKETQHSTDSAKETSSEKNAENVKDKDDVTKDLDKILADLDLSSENVDNHQQKDGETSQAQEQAQPHDKQQTLNHKQTSVLDDLDKIKQDTSLDEDADTTQNKSVPIHHLINVKTHNKILKINQKLLLENCHNLTPKNNKH